MKGVYEPAKQKGAMGLDTTSPLDEIIAKINEKYKGEFTEGDKVLLTALRSRLMADKKLTKMAQTSDPQIFVESIFLRPSEQRPRTAIWNRRIPIPRFLRISTSIMP